MPDDTFQVNLLRLIAAETFFLLGMTASREMFGKAYFALGAHEKVAVDQAVIEAMRSNYQVLTPELLKDRMTAQPAGFSAGQKADTSPEPPKPAGSPQSPRA